MAAGRSAHDVARRQRDKAARLERSAQLWERGAQGEEEVARVLGELPQGWVVVHDLPWPGRPRANIDHVVIGPSGVFVIDAKNWSGKVEVRDQVLLQNGRRREKAVVSARDASTAVQTFLPVPTECRAVLCFVGDDVVTDQVGDVLLCSSNNLASVLLASPPVLHRDGIRLSVDAVRANCSQRSEPPRRAPAPRQQESSSRRGTQRSRRQRREARRAVRGLIALALLFVLLYSGALQQGAQWFGERFVELASPSDEVSEPPPPPKKKPGKQSDIAP